MSPCKREGTLLLYAVVYYCKTFESVSPVFRPRLDVVSIIVELTSMYGRLSLSVRTGIASTKVTYHI